MTKVITNRNPHFLKATYARPDVEHVDHVGFVFPDEKFIQWNKVWMVYRMTLDRVPICCGRFDNLPAALNKARH